MDLAEFAAKKKLVEVDVNVVMKSLGKKGSSPLFRELLAEFGRVARDVDVVYHFCSVQEEWDIHMGSEGYVAIRDGEIIVDIIREMN